MDQKETNSLHDRVGMIVDFSQKIECSLAKIQAYENVVSALNENKAQPDRQKQILVEADKIYHANLAKTLGQNIQGIKDSGIFKENLELVDSLDEVLKERNYVVHQLFKKGAQNQCLKAHTQKVLDRLGNDVGRLNNLNEKLLKIITDLNQQLSGTVM